jgi:signal peptidase I
MPLVAAMTRAARRTLDVLLLLLIVCVLAIVTLARVLPAVTGGTTFVVGGPSMEPTIPLGSAVHAEPVEAAELRVGDVVSLQAGVRQAVFTHRITRIVALPDGMYIETKGDANDGPDPSLVPVKDVLGRVSVSVPFAGFGIALLSSYQGVMFLIAFGLVLLAGAWLLETIEDEQQESRRRAARQALAAFNPESPGEPQAAG